MSQVMEIELEKLFIGKFNVRRNIGDISELKESIKEKGILQPIIVRPSGNKFEIIVGSRRFEASKQLGLKKIPAIIRDMDDADAIIASLAENIHRENLQPKEEAEAYELLKELYPERYGSDRKLAEAFDVDHSRITRIRSILQLESKLQEKVVRYAPPSAREKGEAIPIEHATMLAEAFRIDDIKHLPESEKAKKQEQLAKVIAPLPELDARRVVDEFKKYPDKPIEEIREKALARQLGVALHTYLPPKIAREVDKIAEEKGKSPEEIIPEIVEKSLTTMLVEPERGLEREAVELPRLEMPLPDQYQHQRIWNLKQLINRDFSKRAENFYFDFVTVGFSQKSFDYLVESLKTAGVTLLIDARKNPFSMHKTDFNKNILEKGLPEHKIDYIHLPELGIPRSLRNEAYEGKITSDVLFRRYDNEILTKEVLDKLEKVSKGHRTIAILCTEVDPTMCHRHRIAEALTKRGKIGYDL